MTGTTGAAGIEEREASAASAPPAPPVPRSLADTGLGADHVSDLLLRTLYRGGAREGAALERTLHLPYPILDDELLSLQQRRLIEVRSTRGVGRRGYTFGLTDEGRARCRELMTTNRYVGPAPVPLDQYIRWTLSQRAQDARVNREAVRAGLGGLVLDPELVDLLGPAINSGRAVFLHGEAGNGKSTLAEAVAALLGGGIYVPHAVEVHGQVISVYDPVHHRPEEDPDERAGEAWLRPADGHDARYARVRRPVVMVGGELTLEDLEFRFDPEAGVHRAPPQMLANGGVFIIDDFGRQRVRPRDLLNRWMVPLERRVDYLSLPTGPKVPVPFECLLVFSTNLDPEDLVEEAFLRRIPYKIRVEDPTPKQYREIFRRCCVRAGIPYLPGAVDRIYADYYYAGRGIAPRACHPRDLVDHVRDLARYLEVEPSLSREMLDLACRAYFLDARRRNATGGGTTTEGDAA